MSSPVLLGFEFVKPSTFVDTDRSEHDHEFKLVNAPLQIMRKSSLLAVLAALWFNCGILQAVKHSTASSF